MSIGPTEATSCCCYLFRSSARLFPAPVSLTKSSFCPRCNCPSQIYSCLWTPGSVPRLQATPCQCSVIPTAWQMRCRTEAGAAMLKKSQRKMLFLSLCYSGELTTVLFRNLPMCTLHFTFIPFLYRIIIILICRDFSINLWAEIGPWLLR